MVTPRNWPILGGDAVSPVNNDLKCGQAAVTTHACRSIIDVSVMCLS